MELGAVETKCHNEKRHQVDYLVRIRLKGKQSQPPVVDEQQRQARFARDLWQTLLPRDLDDPASEAWEIALKQGEILDRPLKQVSDPTGVLDLDGGPGLLVGDCLMHFTHRDLVELNCTLIGLPGPRQMRKTVRKPRRCRAGALDSLPAPW